MLSVGDAPREVRAGVLALRAADRELRNAINRETRAVMNPVWRSLVEAHATTHMDTLVLAKGARIAPGNPPSFVAASSRRPLKGGGGFVPADRYGLVEFGSPAKARKATYERRSPKGTVHKVTRRTSTGLPNKAPKGRVVYPAVKEIMPRMVSLWLQTIVRLYHEAAEKVSR